MRGVEAGGARGELARGFCGDESRTRGIKCEHAEMHDDVRGELARRFCMCTKLKYVHILDC